MKKTLFVAILMSVSSAFAAKPTDGLSNAVKRVHNATNKASCMSDVERSPEIYNIGPTTKLYIVPCMNGAYNFTDVAYIESTSGVSPVVVLAADENNRIVTETFLTNAGYDEKTKTLSTFAKGRGIGDCGQSSDTIIKIDKDGILRVRTTEVRSKLNCDEQLTEFPVVFKQK